LEQLILKKRLTMTNEQWNLLVDVVNRKHNGPAPVGFIIDSPWLPGWAGISTLDYYASGKQWFATNKKAIDTFPGTIFLPGFWSEYGMCSEPSAFGAKQVWYESNLPHADKTIHSVEDIAGIKKPNPKLDGLLPFIIQRLKEFEPDIHEMGHEIKFAIARGPLNIATFLMGTTEFMMLLMMNPDEAHQLLKVISEFTVDWLRYQKEQFPSIEGILVLDDIVGFVGEDECREFVVPYLTPIFGAFETKIRFFHNDAQGLISTPFLKEIGINLFNFSFEHSINEIRELAGPEVALLGNLPPRDVLMAATPEKVKEETVKMWNEVEDKKAIIWSCGGGVPQNVSTVNMQAFIETINELEKQ
jgi:uroporphyrinogen decarboxylase